MLQSILGHVSIMFWLSRTTRVIAVGGKDQSEQYKWYLIINSLQPWGLGLQTLNTESFYFCRIIIVLNISWHSKEFPSIHCHWNGFFCFSILSHLHKHFKSRASWIIRRCWSLWERTHLKHSGRVLSSGPLGFSGVSFSFCTSGSQLSLSGCIKESYNFYSICADTQMWKDATLIVFFIWWDRVCQISWNKDERLPTVWALVF